jgi:hypothetical protein
MTKKDYELVAKSISKTLSGVEDGEELLVIMRVVDNLVESFKADNPRFNESRFRKACQSY